MSIMDDIKQKIKGALAPAGVVALGGALIISTVISLIGGGSTSDSTSGEWDGSADFGDYIIKTDEEGHIPTLSKKQLKSAIEKHYTNKVTHDNYIAGLDGFMSIQEKYNVNAAFAVAVAQAEHQGGAAWGSIPPDYHNFFSVKTSDGRWMEYNSFNDSIEAFGYLLYEGQPLYFKSGRYSVEDIGSVYCPGSDNSNWDNLVKGEIEAIYSAADVSLPSKGSASGEAIVAKGEKMMKTLIDEKYSYVQGNLVPKSKNDEKNGKRVDCSTYVCWVLYELGWENCQSGGAQLSSYTMPAWFEQNGWKKGPTEKDKLLPGDIIIYAGHVEIFAKRENGVNYVLTAGSAPSSYSSVFQPIDNRSIICSYRVP